MAKYKVGDLVKAKFGKETYHILEIGEQTCEAGTQVKYTVKGYIKMPGEADGKLLMAVKELSVREMELGEKVETIS